MEEQNTSDIESQSQPTETSTPANKNTSSTNATHFIFGIGLVVLLLAGGYWYMQTDETDSELVVDTDSEEAIEADTVVAEVNGTKLLGASLNPQIALFAQQVGIPDLAAVDTATRLQIRSQALDSIINTELVAQKASASNIEVTDEDIDAEFDKIVAGVGGIEIAEERLQQLGVTVDEFKETLVNDILIRKYLEAITDPADLAVSDEEARATYDQVSAGATEEVPPFDEVRFQIEEQLKFQKQQSVLGTIIEELRAEADIEILI